MLWRDRQVAISKVDKKTILLPAKSDSDSGKSEEPKFTGKEWSKTTRGWMKGVMKAAKGSRSHARNRENLLHLIRSAMSAAQPISRHQPALEAYDSDNDPRAMIGDSDA